MENAVKIVGLRIKNLRQNLHLSQEKLAEMSFLHTTYIGQLERGQKNPSLLSLLKIANALNVTPESLIADLSNAERYEPTVPDKAFAFFSNLNNSDGEKMLEILNKIENYKNEK